MAGGDDAVHHSKDPGAVAGRQGVDAVAHRPAAGAGHQREDAGADPHALAPAQVGEVGLERIRGDEAEGVVVSARADRADDLLRLGGGEDELHVRRRLLDEFEQGVEALRGDHVGLVEDEDLEAVASRSEGGALTQVSGIVDAVVGGGVDLDDIEAAGSAGGQIAATRAPAARGVGGEVLAVQTARQNAGGGGLAAASRAGEEVGVGDAVAAQRRHERGGHVVLPDDVLERVGAVAAVQGGGHGPTLNGTDGAPHRVAGRGRSPRSRSEDPPCTRQSPLTLATFRSWGIHWMTPHEGPATSVPDGGAGARRRARRVSQVRSTHEDPHRPPHRVSGVGHAPPGPRD